MERKRWLHGWDETLAMPRDRERPRAEAVAAVVNVDGKEGSPKRVGRRYVGMRYWQCRGITSGRGLRLRLEMR